MDLRSVIGDHDNLPFGVAEYYVASLLPHTAEALGFGDLCQRRKSYQSQTGHATIPTRSVPTNSESGSLPHSDLKIAPDRFLNILFQPGEIRCLGVATG